MKPSRSWIAPIALIVAVISLLLNVILLITLRNFGKDGIGAAEQVRAAAIDSVDQSVSFVRDLRVNGIHVDFPISQTLQIKRDIPLNLDLTFPIRTNIPIDTIVSIPINLGIGGTRLIDIPISATVPINLNIPVKINRTFSLDLPLDINFVLPFDLEGDQPPLSEWLTFAQERLTEIRTQLEALTLPALP